MNTPSLDPDAPRPVWPDLPAAPLSYLDEARSAVRAEQRIAGRARRLDTLEVHEEPDSPGIYRLDVGDLSEGDASWENARAFKPVDLADTARLLAGEQVLTLQEMRWSGEVVAVDEAASAIWIAVEPGADAPCPGEFLVLPFDFLAGLQGACDADRHPAWRDALCRALGRALDGPIAPDSASPMADADLTDEGSPGDDLTDDDPTDDDLTDDDLTDDDDDEEDPDYTAEQRRALAQARMQAHLIQPWAILWGPPGTGKTWNLGHEVARLAPRERVLVVSTTNRATDAAALHIGRALSEPGQRPIDAKRAANLLKDGRIRRVGWGADIAQFEAEQLIALLDPESVAARRELARVVRARSRSRTSSERARWGVALGELRANVGNELREAMGPYGPRVVIATAFAAVRALRDPDLLGWLEVHGGSFDRVVIDEAGLISRAAAATLALWARRGVLLVGDPRQLAPIARQSRVLAPSRGRWVAESALAFLAAETPLPLGVHRLSEQHRMHPDIRAVVSHYQYDGELRDAAAIANRVEVARDAGLQDQPRALWLVLDEHEPDLARRRASRGPSHRSWVRKSSLELFARLLDHLPHAAASSGLFISPFRAQAHAAARLLEARPDTPSWRASTVHAQQGAEAEFVVFDAVRASSTGWPEHEWRRLVNVALSRARTQVLLIAARDELVQPWMRPLLAHVQPRRASFRQGGLRLEVAPGLPAGPLTTLGGRHCQARAPHLTLPGTLGAQLASRRQMRPITSAEQERLCGLRLDGGPRLVRGVAGSGKTWILATWVARTLADPALNHLNKVWLVYGNHALKPLLLRLIQEAWRAAQPDRPMPTERLAVLHIKGVLTSLLREQGQAIDGFDYEQQAQAWLDGHSRVQLDGAPPEPRCDALFVDEAQDMGAVTLTLLFGLVRPWDPDRPGRRAVHVFYDNDQNVFARATPRWSDLGLDLRGRAAIMQTSFRSTRPIVELARNLRYQLAPPKRDPDHDEAVRRGMLAVDERLGRRWWRVRFAEVDGPLPSVRAFQDRDAELTFLAETITRWLTTQTVAPEDVVVLVNGAEARQRVTGALQRALAGGAAARTPGAARVLVSEQRGQSLQEEQGVLRVTTAHSFKGHEAEVVVVACADTFVAGDGHGGRQPLVAPLYVALTRARSVLLVTGLQSPRNHAAQRIMSALTSCHGQQRNAPVVRDDLPRQRLLQLLAERLGDRELSRWLAELDERMELTTDPIWTDDGRLIAAPVVQLRQGRSRWVVFRDPGPSLEVLALLRDVGVGVLQPGQQPGAQATLGL